MSAEATKAASIQSRFLVLTHFMVDGAPQALVRHLSAQVGIEVTYVAHPLEAGFADHECLIASHGETRVQTHLKPLVTVPVLCWIWDIIITIYWIIKFKRTYEVCVAAGCVNVAAALFLKRVGIVKMVIFYSIDFVPRRFENAILQNLYRMSDNAAFLMADVTWCLTDRMVEARKAQVGAWRRGKRDVIVPIGIDCSVQAYDEQHLERYSLVYVGMILEKQGLQIVIPALRALQGKFPALRMRIVGDGPYLPHLRELAREHDVGNMIEFHGLITDRVRLTELVGTAAIGLAPYAPNNESFTWYADPTKPKDYLALAIPVVITEVPAIAQTIHDAGAGQVVSYRSQDVADAIERFLADDDYWRGARQAAYHLSRTYCWDAVFTRAIACSLIVALGAQQ